MSFSDRIKNLNAEVLPVCSELGAGYENEEFIGHLLYPFAERDKMEGRIPLWGKEAFLVHDAERAIGADSNEMLPGQRSWTDFRTQEYDLEYPVDYLEEQEDIIDAQAEAAELTTEGIRLILEKKQADDAQNLANYGSDNKITLSGTDQWTDKENSDPKADIKLAIETVGNKIGKDPNLLILGRPSFYALIDHPSLEEKIKYSQKAILTKELLKEILGIPNLAIGVGRYAASIGVAFSNIWGDVAIVAHVKLPGDGGSNTKRSVKKPNFGYTVRLKGNPYSYWYNKTPKVKRVNSTDNFVVKRVMTDAAYIINDTCA